MVQLSEGATGFVNWTIEHVFRYFLPGAYLLLLGRWFDCGIERRLGFIDGTRQDAFGYYLALFVLALVIGTISYVTHRVLIYPVVHRWLIRTVLPQWTLEPWWWWQYWRPLAIERELSVARVAKAAGQRYISGWSAEIHLAYQLVELFPVAVWMCLPMVNPLSLDVPLALIALAATLGIPLAGLLIFCWDRAATETEIRLNVPSVAVGLSTGNSGLDQWGGRLIIALVVAITLILTAAAIVRMCTAT